MKFTDNTQVPVTLQDGRVVMENVNPGRFELPERNKVQAAFFRFQHWQNRILENRGHGDPNTLERELEIITGNMLPLAVKILKYTAKSYGMPDPLSDRLQDYWTHPPFDLSCRSGMLESGDCVPAAIQLKVEELNDLLREAERRLKRSRAADAQSVLSVSPEISTRIIRRLVQEAILDYAGDMVLAGQRKAPDTDGNTQNPLMPMVRNGTDSLPVTGNPTLQPTADPKAPYVSEEIKPYSHRRQESRSPRKTKATQDRIAAERRRVVLIYIDEVYEKSGKRITKTDFWKAAAYKDRSEFERWQRNDPKTTKVANERFLRILREKPHLK